jgi:hypothetical protein
MHDLGADGLKVMFHLKVIRYGIVRQDVFKQFPEPGDVLLPVAKIVDQGALGHIRCDAKGLVKRMVGLYDFQISIKHHQRFTNRAQNVIENFHKRPLWFRMARARSRPARYRPA